MKTEDLQNLALGVAAIGLAYAMYRVFKKTPAKTSTTVSTSAPAPTGAVTWTNGQPSYTNFAPYDSSTLAGQLAINKLLAGTVGDLNFNGFA